MWPGGLCDRGVCDRGVCMTRGGQCVTREVMSKQGCVTRWCDWSVRILLECILDCYCQSVYFCGLLF